MAVFHSWVARYCSAVQMRTSSSLWSTPWRKFWDFHASLFLRASIINFWTCLIAALPYQNKRRLAMKATRHNPTPRLKDQSKILRSCTISIWRETSWFSRRLHSQGGSPTIPSTMLKKTKILWATRMKAMLLLTRPRRKFKAGSS